MHLLRHALSRAGETLRRSPSAHGDQGTGYSRSIGWDVTITNGEPLLIEGNVTWDPAYEGPVGAEIFRAIRADKPRQGAESSLQPVVSR